MLPNIIAKKTKKILAINILKSRVLFLSEIFFNLNFTLNIFERITPLTESSGINNARK